MFWLLFSPWHPIRIGVVDWFSGLNRGKSRKVLRRATWKLYKKMGSISIALFLSEKMWLNFNRQDGMRHTTQSFAYSDGNLAVRAILK